MKLISWATPAGLCTGLAAWLIAGGATANHGKLDDVEAELMSLRPPAARISRVQTATADLIGAPLFALTLGPGALREPSIRVDGLSVSHRRIAALISVDGKPAVWVRPGERQDGVTVRSITASSVTLETELGSKTLNLGEQSAASAPDPGATSVASPPIQQTLAPDQMPPGFRSPPEPASAPSSR